MTLTIERADILSNLLADNLERAKELLQLDPAEAVAVINAQGYDFSVEELNEYGKALKITASNGELSEEDLEDVAGGGAILTICGAAAIAFVAGVVVGGVEKSGIW